MTSAKRKRACVPATSSLLLDMLPPELLDHVLTFLWPEGLESLSRAASSCRALRQRPLPILRTIAMRLCAPARPFHLASSSGEFGKGLARLDCDVTRAHRIVACVKQVPAAGQPTVEQSKALSSLKELNVLVVALHAPFILSLLGHASSQLRTLALHVLRPLGAEWNATHSVLALVRRLDDDNHWARNATLRAMEDISASHPSALEPHLRPIAAQLSASGFDADADHLVRRSALMLLRRATAGARSSQVAGKCESEVAAALPSLEAHDEPGVRAFAREVKRWLTIELPGTIQRKAREGPHLHPAHLAAVAEVLF